MTRSHRLASLALAATLLGTALVAAVAAPAVAHTPSASATCTTLTVSLQSYNSSRDKPKPNTVSISIDGSPVDSQSFGKSFAHDYPLGDSTRAHTWRVVIDAVDNGYDRTFDGTSKPCPAPLPKDAAASVHTTPPTCAAAGTLVLDSPVNATWSTPTGATGPSQYSVTATATRGHLFDDGTTSRVFTGSLPAALDASSEACKPTTPPVVVPPPVIVTPPPVVTPPKPAPLAVSGRVVTVDCVAKIVTTTTTTTTRDWVLDADGVTWVQSPPVVTTVDSTKPATDTSCPIVNPGGGSGEGEGADGGVGNGAGNGAAGAVSQAAGVGTLAHAGTDSLVAVAIALALLVAGAILAIVRRRSNATQPE